jgi:hypothetical protein
MNHSHLNTSMRRGGHLARHRLARRPRRHARSTPASSAKAGIPFIFDPGQGLPMFDGADLNGFIDLATYVTVNDYEGAMHRGEAPARQLGGARCEAREGVDRHAGGSGSTIFAAASASRSRREGREPWSTRPAAATPIAPACSMASRNGYDWPLDRPARFADRCDQDHIARRPEPHHDPRRHRCTLPTRVRPRAVVTGQRAVVPPRVKESPR